ncbi:MAG: hypothetical protein RL139_130, partial [Gemmatimonadota bacterium]
MNSASLLRATALGAALCCLVSALPAQTLPS